MNPTIFILIMIGLIGLSVIAFQARQSNHFSTAPVLNTSPSPTKILSNPTVTGEKFTDFYYPDSQQSTPNKNSVILENSDNPKDITDWYKNKIKSLGFKTTSVIETNTNGNILNTLVAVNNSQQVDIEISKNTNQPKTRITLTF